MPEAQTPPVAIVRVKDSSGWNVHRAASGCMIAMHEEGTAPMAATATATGTAATTITAIEDPVPPRALAVTRPLLPELDTFLEYVRDIFARRWLTNNGRYVQRLESALAAYLGVSQVAAVTNATVGLDLALRALEVEGEVITTGYSFPATYHVLLQNPRLTPVFVDIDEHFCLDPAAVAEQITPRTRAILAVHTYGYPCAVAELGRLAQHHRLPLIYDAAPAFGVTLDGRGIGAYGDLAVFSFHATKVFTTLEGGCIASGDARPDLLDRLRLLRNFGIKNEEEIVLFGLNGKMDEMRAAFGLAALPLVEAAIARRRWVVEQYLAYFEALEDEQFAICWDLYRRPDLRLNYAYFPLLIHPSSSLDRDVLYAELRRCGIYARRYFYPTVANSPLYQGRFDPAGLRRTDYASRHVLCLPVHHEMAAADCAKIIAAVDRVSRARRSCR